MDHIYRVCVFGILLITTCQGNVGESLKEGPSDVFYVKDIAGNVCMVLKMEATFNIVYLTTKNENNTVPISLGRANETHVSGQCMNTNWLTDPEQTMEIRWKPKIGGLEWTLSLVASQHPNLTYYISSLRVDYNRSGDLFPEASDLGSKHSIMALSETKHNRNVTLFESAFGSYYRCLAEERVSMEEGAWMQVHQVTFNAFRGARNDTTFVGTPYQCKTDVFASNIIPIIVGCVLAFLILLLLVTYLVGRRRGDTSGYQNI